MNKKTHKERALSLSNKPSRLILSFLSYIYLCRFIYLFLKLEKEKFTKLSIASTSQPKGKKMKMEDKFQHIIPNILTNQIKISVDSSGNVGVCYLKMFVTITEKNVCPIPMTKFSYEKLFFLRHKTWSTI